MFVAPRKHRTHRTAPVVVGSGSGLPDDISGMIRAAPRSDKRTGAGWMRALSHGSLGLARSFRVGPVRGSGSGRRHPGDDL